jgi:predicted DNA-binding transcriptional regulator YafY
MDAIDPRMVVTIRYTNYRGETAIRRIIPREVRFISTEWHPEPQWVLEAYDLDRKAERSFAIKDINDWNPTGEPVSAEVPV